MNSCKVDVMPGGSPELNGTGNGMTPVNRPRRFSVVHVPIPDPPKPSPTPSGSRSRMGWTKDTSLSSLRFQDPDLERLYLDYQIFSKCMEIAVIPVLCLIGNISAIILSAVYYRDYLQAINIALNGFFAHVNVAIFVKIGRLKSNGSTIKKANHCILWLYMIVQLLTGVILLYPPVTPTTGLGWVLLIITVMFAVSPLSLPQCFVASIFTWISQAAMTTIVAAAQPYGAAYDLPSMVGASVLLFVAVVVNGAAYYVLMDATLRKAFLETRDSLSSKRIIEESSKEQESLLLSVLPKHVAAEMVQDLGAEISGQFRKVYMNRHENVSILFADIVGFTAMSSKVTPTELVYILNDLFATFDKLAQRFHQLRIKILGDCYYCISGCPDPRPDHAVVSIHMGLAMIDAISDVREKTKSGVNMRVGIHTGAVLGGVMGQNRWQYDVLGKEVSLANKMESGGLPGRVHISEVTASFLDREFELEPGDGDQREDDIRAAGIKTFLIKSVLIPYPKDQEGSLGPQHEENEGCNFLATISNLINTTALPISHDDGMGACLICMTSRYSKRNVFKFAAEPISELDVGVNMKSSQKALDTLIESERHMSIRGEFNPVTLRFHDDRIEDALWAQRNEVLSVTAGTNAICLVFIAFALICAMPRFWYAFVPLAVVLLVSTVIFASRRPKWFPRVFLEAAERLKENEVVVTLVAIFILSCNCVLIFANMLHCKPTDSYRRSNVTDLRPTASSCAYPEYYTHATLVVIFSILTLHQIRFLVSIATICIIGLCYCIIVFASMGDVFEYHDFIVEFSGGLEFLIPSIILNTAEIITLSIVTIFFARFRQLRTRELMFYRHGLEETKSQVDQLRKKNEALIYNILPSHVAKDFIGARKSDEELYSHHYEETATMFASCPNFNDHYSEDAINNNGLEWMRFLNEVLSDYDDLLNEPRFRHIIKIKTIGPTYMAASGINIETHFSKKTPASVRWRHLADLVEFALALKETLDRINLQSFNNFMLRIGINHGSVLAGVIGARKPHYDIWGNSVNVASRMESTGQLGKIQVVESTMMLLREFGYTFEKRGLVKVKGKGELMTYFLTGKIDIEESL